MIAEQAKEAVKARVNLAEWIMRDGVVLKGGGAEWKGPCPFHKEGDPSFTVFLKEGFWGFHCFGCNEGGDIFSWIMKRRGLDFPTALRLIASHEGIALDDPQVYQPAAVKAAAVPKRGAFDPEAYRQLDPGSRAFRYLTQERRLRPENLASYSVGETVDGEAYAFAYKWQPAGFKRAKFEFLKVVKVDRPEGKKVEWRDPKGGRSILFGMDAVDRSVEAKAQPLSLVICEGEIDALTWAGYGYLCVSIPSGAGYAGWIDTCWEWLQKWTRIYVSFDEDRAGRAKLVEVVQRLGIQRTDIVRLPFREEAVRFKDANECLQAGVTSEQMAAALTDTEVLRPDHLCSILDFEEEIWSRFHPSGKEQVGLLLPWGNRNGSSLPFRVRYGEVSVWTGFNKHGKSEVLNHVVVDLCWQGERALICSLEISAPQTYQKLIRMAMGTRHVCAVEERAQFRERCLKPLAERVWVYDHVGTAQLAEVLIVMTYAFQRYGCRQFVLDSLMRFEGLDGEGQEIWNAQRGFMSQLLEFASRYNVHVHLVAHSRKPDGRKGEGTIPRRFDIMGSVYISNLAFNVIVVWRNRAKHDALAEVLQACEDAWVKDFPNDDMPPWKRLLGGRPSKHQPQFLPMWQRMIDTLEKVSPALKQTFQEQVVAHDSYLLVDAQRGGDGDTVARKLWFHADSLQFVEGSPFALGNDDPRSKPTLYAQRPVAEMDLEL